MQILIPVLLLLGTGALCAVLLTVAAVFFGVEEDERANKIRDCLPGANCGACGFSGCDGYAKALSEGKTTKTNLHTLQLLTPLCSRAHALHQEKPPPREARALHLESSPLCQNRRRPV